MALSQKVRTAALGLIEPHLEKFFKPNPAELFFKLPTPESGDWLSSHEEEPQGVPEFLDYSRNEPNSSRNVIYLLPLGKFKEGESPHLPTLKEYVEIFYGNSLNVTLLPPIDISAEKITTRKNQYSKQKQMLVSDIFTILKTKIPSDAYCLLGITMVDLYPKPEWNFVFGQASIRNRYGVFSFARYNPAFYGEKVSQQEYENILLRRCCRVCSHEIGHMFGIKHCAFYDCLMSGSNHLGESDAMPLHLCPVDLRKLQLTCKFDIKERYNRMLEFYKRYGGHFDSEIDWISKMLAYAEK